MIDSKNIGRGLVSLRKKYDVTLEELSQKVDIHRNTLYRYEKDSAKLMIGNLIKILSVYGMTLSIFFKFISDYNYEINKED